MIRIQSLSKNFKQVPVLQDVSFVVEKGDIYGIIGLSGAGKSTLIRSLARLVVPSSGNIFFHGKDLVSLKKKELREFRKKIGMIFQHFNLLQSRTVAENIAFPLELNSISNQELIQERVEQLLHLVGLAHKKDSYPSQLSGGEKQRVGIARALAPHPELLLCDEATSALDPKTTREILQLLKTLHKKLGFTMILITHEMEVVKQLCNKVAVLDQGKIVEEGPISTVFAHPRHHTTQQFLRTASHDIPQEFFKPSSPTRKNLHLQFLGAATKEPIISEMSRKFMVNANILGGWIDHVQSTTIGTLIIELTGESEQIEQALLYLKEKMVHYDEL